MTTSTRSKEKRPWWKSYPVWIGAIVATMTLVSSIVLWVDGRYAHAEELTATKIQVQQYQLRTTRSLTSIELNNLQSIIAMELKKPVRERDEALIFQTQQQIERLMVDYETLSKDIKVQ